VQLEVFNELERRDITNVLGVIQGSEEPGINNFLLILMMMMLLVHFCCWNEIPQWTVMPTQYQKPLNRWKCNTSSGYSTGIIQYFRDS